MKGWLLDTNVISELRKPRCDPRVKAWADKNPPGSFYLSRITIAEIRFGIERVPPANPFRAELQTWLESSLRPWFAGRILDVDEEVILTWRRLVARGRLDNYTFAQPDLFIAASAAVHDLCVVTRNVEDFLRARVPVLNPWIDPAPRGIA
jgi:predicted nucleic acid-binding protein